MNKRSRSLNVEYVSPVSGYYDSHNNSEVSNLLLANSVDSFRNALSQFMSPNDANSNYKHVILLLDHSIEALLKTRLCLEDKSLILRNQRSMKFGISLSINECVKELQKRDVSLGDNFKSAINDLHRVRNDIWHFGFLGRKEPLDDLISYCSSIYWVFLMKYLPKYGIRTMLDGGQFDTLLSFEQRWHLVKAHAAELMCEWHQKLDVEQDRYLVRYCSECLNLSLIIDNQTASARCKCCGHEAEAEK